MKFKVGISGDLLNESNKPCFGDSALKILTDRTDIDISWMDKSIKEITPEMASEFDAILLNLPQATANSVSREDCKLKIISRFGVGYDSVDIQAMKQKGIIVTNTPNAVRRPVAVAALTMVLALSGRLLQKNELVRSDRWNSRTNFMGIGLSKKTLGIVGAGSIGAETIKLSQPFFGNILAFDPFLTKEELYNKGATKADLIKLANESDFIIILCNLNDQTNGMIDKTFFSNMKKSAYIINLSRGSVINEADLVTAIQQKLIAGAGIDVTTAEPPKKNHPYYKIIKKSNFVWTPHTAWASEEALQASLRQLIHNINRFYAGRPRNLV